MAIVSFPLKLGKELHTVGFFASETKHKHLRVDILDVDTGENLGRISLFSFEKDIYKKVPDYYDVFLNTIEYKWLPSYLLKHSIAKYKCKYAVINGKSYPLWHFSKDKLSHFLD